MHTTFASLPNQVVRTASSRLTAADRWRHVAYRWGIGRSRAAVAPGLYALGRPGKDAPVMVSANYRMSFDILRSALAEQDAWILVLDTRGINVWCAAGKGTFGTDEIVRQVAKVGLAAVVNHRRLIVPQLGAPGVAAHVVKRRTGFSVAYGPVRAKDLPAYLINRGQATEAMRRVTFGWRERMVLIPLEVQQAFLPALAVAVAVWLLAGNAAALIFFLAAVSTGAVVPLAHDLLPGHWLSIKGAIWGILSAGVIAGLMFSWPRVLPLVALTGGASAFFGLNFTGSTTYTSVHGVEREMKAVLPLIIAAAALGLTGFILLRIFA